MFLQIKRLYGDNFIGVMLELFYEIIQHRLQRKLRNLSCQS